MASGLTFIPLSESWDRDYRPPTPTDLAVSGASPLFYRGEVHLLYGKGGSGKTWLGLLACLQAATLGFRAVLIDYEGTVELALHRLKQLGCTSDSAARIYYCKARGPLDSAVVKALAEWMTTAEVRVLVIDSLGRALAAADFEEQSNGDINRFFDSVEPLRSAGASIVFIDHIGHQRDGGGMPSPRGASAKVDQVSAAYWMRVRQPWSEEKPGSGELLVRKDRFGTRAEGEVAAEVRVLPRDRGISFVLRAPQAPCFPGVDDQDLAAVVLELSRDEESSKSKSALSKAAARSASSSVGAAEDAIDQMVNAGFLSALKGGNGSPTRYAPRAA